MQYRLGIALLATCLLVAGCVGSVGGEARPANDDDASEVQTNVENTTGAGSDARSTPPPVVLAIDADADSGAATHVERAVESLSNATDGQRFVVVPAAVTAGQSALGLGPMGIQPDAVVRFADERVTCEPGGAVAVPFCVDGQDGAASRSRPANVTISPGLTAAGSEAATRAALAQLTGADEQSATPEVPAAPFATPWPGSDPVTVTIENEVAPDREFEPLVAETLRWWEARDDRWGNYTTDWRLVDGPDADVTVTFVDRVRSCGDHSDPGSLLGCAPVLDPSTPADADERVRIRGGFTDETTLHVLKHEFGHVYGRSHGEAPAEIMDATIPTTRRSASDAG